jgi:hypothetical protein
MAALENSKEANNLPQMGSFLGLAPCVLREGLLLVIVLGLLLVGCAPETEVGAAAGAPPAAAVAPNRPGEDTISSTPVQGLAEECLLVQDGHVGGQAFWDRTGAIARDGQLVSLIFDAGPLLSQRIQNGAYSFAMLARQCGDETEWIGFSVRYGESAEYIKPDTADVYQDIVSTGAGSNTPADARECALVLGEFQGRVRLNGEPVPDGTVVLAAMGPASVTPERALQTVETRDGYYSLTAVGNRCGEKESWIEWSISALGEQISLTPSGAHTTQDLIITSSL